MLEEKVPAGRKLLAHKLNAKTGVSLRLLKLDSNFSCHSGPLIALLSF